MQQLHTVYVYDRANHFIGLECMIYKYRIINGVAYHH